MPTPDKAVATALAGTRSHRQGDAHRQQIENECREDDEVRHGLTLHRAASGMLAGLGQCAESPAGCRARLGHGPTPSPRGYET